jgi:hypothetical protein
MQGCRGIRQPCVDTRMSESDSACSIFRPPEASLLGYWLIDEQEIVTVRDLKITNIAARSQDFHFCLSTPLQPIEEE